MKKIHVDDYDIGFGKPPDAYKFKSGRSGNPKGRPKRPQRADGEDPLKTELLKKTTVTVNGKRTKMTIIQAVIKTTIKKALTGCTKSIKLLADWTDGFKSIIEEAKREASSADQAYLEEVRREANAWATR